jgi:hypothetical protein
MSLRVKLEALTASSMEAASSSHPPTMPSSTAAQFTLLRNS